MTRLWPDITYIRNDVLAAEMGVCLRTLDRGDVKGAPFRYIAGTKYRPREQYADWFNAGIRTRGKPPSRRRNHK